MKALRVANRQSLRGIDGRFLRQVARALCDELVAWGDYDLGVILVDAETMAGLNHAYLQHQGSTDVITFSYAESPSEIRGEIFISLADALAQARQFRRPWTEEVVRYVVHGALHLAGHEDLAPGPRRAMKREENRLLKELSRRFDLRKLERPKNV